MSMASMSDLPEGLILRRLQKDDFDKGYMNLLAQLTEVGQVSRASFDERVDELQADDQHFVVVIEDTNLGKIVATATLLVEKKLLRNCGKVGHVEDVVVDSEKRGGRLGQRLLSELDRIAREEGCYKVILDCNESNVGFYAKCGYTKKEVQMARYFI